MPAEIKIQCRVQYLRRGKWVTINKDDGIIATIESDLVGALTAWVKWFEDFHAIFDFNTEICPICLSRLNEGGHSETCIYVQTKKLIDNPHRADFGMKCPVCGFLVEDADYWHIDRCLRCAMEKSE